MKMIADIALLLIPLFATIAGGYLLAKFFPLSEDTLVRVLTDLVAPLMIFYSLYTSDLSGGTIMRISGAAFFVVLLLSLAALLWTRVSRLDRKAYMPPILFYNTGFLGIPLMQLWGGLEAVNIIVIYDQMQGIAIFTLGILIVTGGFSFQGVADMFKAPIMWAVILGFLFNFTRIPVPEVLLNTAEFSGKGMASLAAITLGCSLTKRKLLFDSHLAAGMFLRVVIGFLAGVAGAYLFGLSGTAKTVFVVGSALPSAVFSYVITNRYGADTDFTGTMILVSTVLGVLTIPLTFWALRFF
jgi:hypothetical protein